MMLAVPAQKQETQSMVAHPPPMMLAVPGQKQESGGGRAHQANFNGRSVASHTIGAICLCLYDNNRIVVNTMGQRKGADGWVHREEGRLWGRRETEVQTPNMALRRRNRSGSLSEANLRGREGEGVPAGLDRDEVGFWYKQVMIINLALNDPNLNF